MGLLTNLEADLKAWCGEIEAEVEGAVKTEEQIAAPVIASTVSNLAESEVQTLVSGNASQAGAVAAKIITQSADALGAQSAQVGINTLLEGVQTTVTSIQNAAKTSA